MAGDFSWFMLNSCFDKWSQGAPLLQFPFSHLIRGISIVLNTARHDQCLCNAAFPRLRQAKASHQKQKKIEPTWQLKPKQATARSTSTTASVNIDFTLGSQRKYTENTPYIEYERSKDEASRRFLSVIHQSSRFEDIQTVALPAVNFTGTTRKRHDNSVNAGL